MDISALAAEFISSLDEQQPHDGTAWFRDPDYSGPCELLDSNKVDILAAGILDFIANVVANIIDAGSERDAVNENADLLEAIKAELKGWTRDGN